MNDDRLFIIHSFEKLSALYRSSIRRQSRIVILLSLLILSGCSNAGKVVIKSPMPIAMVVMEAKYTTVPIAIDGKLDDIAWQKAKVYKMVLSEDRYEQSEQVQENGTVRLAWDDDYFYLGIDFEDSDIIAKSDKDQLHHYLFGDLAELFLKPADNRWYWELYVTPAGKKTSFWLSDRLVIDEGYNCGLKVAATCNGIINDPSDPDISWSAEMAMPVKNLTELGDRFDSGSNWRIFVSRYNFLNDLEERELTMYPMLSETNFHLLEEYAILKLVN
jgi:hypothetical protein